MNPATSRRDALMLGIAALSGAALGLSGCSTAPSRATVSSGGSKPLFRISISEWALHRALYAKQITNLDFPRYVKTTYGIDGVEYVNSFWKDKATDQAYLRELKSICDGEGVTSILIMCDGEGALGDPDSAARSKTIENHHRWVDAAKFLGCHSIRVNAQSKGTWDEQMKLAADGLHRLCEYGDTQGINVIVENHGGLSSNANWLTAMIRMANHPRSGTLPDFGNFENATDAEGNRKPFDRYVGVEMCMPFARGVSAKSHDFDDAGNEVHTDFRRMLGIVLKSGYRGWVELEYEGDKIAEDAGIRATKLLLERVRSEFAASGQFA